MANLIERQRRLIEVGIIRTGEKRKTSDGKKEYPAALDNFRLTSANKSLLEIAAKEYGGEVRPWEGHPGQYELYTETNTLKAIISTKPVGGDGDTESLSQHWERWAGNTCTHRCDGCKVKMWQQVGTERGKPKYDRIERPCQCDHDDPDFSELAAKGKACKLTSRLSVILPSMPALGLWRLNTGSMQFASEVDALIEMIDRLGLTGLQYVTLTIEKRQNRTGPGADTEKFNVVRVELDAQPDPLALPRMISALQARPGLGDVPAIDPNQAGALAARNLSQEEIEQRGKQALAEVLDWCGAIGMDESAIERVRQFCRNAGLRFVNDVKTAKDCGRVTNEVELYSFLENGEIPTGEPQ